jgi:hypothetical protein
MKLGMTRQSACQLWKFCWFSGAACFAMGNILNFVSFSMAPQSLLAAVSSWQFVSNLFFARFLLAERVRHDTILATIAMMGGVFIILRFVSAAPEAKSRADLVDRYADPQYLAFLFFQGIAAYGFDLAFRKSTHGSRIRPLLFALSSALIGAQSVVHSKSLSILIRRKQADGWFTLIIVASLLLTQVFWLKRMQRALVFFPGVVIIPTLQVCWTAASIITGGIFFGEFGQLAEDYYSLCGFVSGMMILFIGAIALAWFGDTGSASSPLPCPVLMRSDPFGKGPTVFKAIWSSQYNA